MAPVVEIKVNKRVEPDKTLRFQLIKWWLVGDINNNQRKLSLKQEILY